MDMKSCCPCCGVHTVVQISKEEKETYYKTKGKLPSDFNQRSICPCCLDDGYKLIGNGMSLYNMPPMLRAY